MYVPIDRRISVSGIDTRYWMEGEGSPVVLIHGLSNSVEDWLLNIPALAAGHRVYALDLFGHGKTDKPLDVPYHFSDFARFVVRFMDALNIPRADLIGHSLGGAVTLVLAENYPERVRRLVLVDSGGLAPEIGLVLRLASVPGLGELAGRIFFQGDFEKRRKLQRESWPDPRIVPDEMIRLKYEATRWENIRQTYFKALRASADITGMKESAYGPIVRELPRMKAPVLVVWGEQDDLLPVRQAQIIKDNAPNARVEIFENCKHDPMVVSPERFNQLALDFLEDEV
jgi:pimeloyl-ACP methyl ester carboxylesterase